MKWSILYQLHRDLCKKNRHWERFLRSTKSPQGESPSRFAFKLTK